MIRNVWARVVLSALAASIAACGSLGSKIELPDSDPSTSAFDWSGEPSERAVERWQAVNGEISWDCRAYAHSVTFEWMDAAHLERACSEPSLLGCFRTDEEQQPVAYVRDDVYANVLVHEVMHALAACQRANSDAQHAQTELWVGLMGNGVN